MKKFKVLIPEEKELAEKNTWKDKGHESFKNNKWLRKL